MNLKDVGEAAEAGRSEKGGLGCFGEMREDPGLAEE